MNTPAPLEPLIDVPRIPDEAFEEIQLMRRALSMMVGRMEPHQQEFVAGLREHVRRIEEICSELNGYHVLREPVASEEIGPVELHAVAESVVASVRRSALYSGLRLVYRGAGESAWVRGNEHFLREALSALVSNALKFSHRGHVIVAVRAEGDQAGFAIEDRGPGLTMAQLATYVQPFRQGTNDDDRTYDGLGLGLTLVDSVARRYGGALSAETGSDGGSIVSLRFSRTADPSTIKLRRVA